MTTTPTLDRLATFACQRLTKSGHKRENCPCDPCLARRAIFGKNLNVAQQEQMRMEGKCDGFNGDDTAPSQQVRQSVLGTSRGLGEGDMTTMPTPELIAKWRLLAEANDGSFYVIPVLNALDEAATACEALIAERDESRCLLDAANAELNRVRGHMPGTVADWVHAHDNMQVERDIAREERDQALARVEELSNQWTECIKLRGADMERAEKAEARVAVLREAIKDHCFHPIRPGTRDTCMYCEALAPEDQAASALLAERDHWRSERDRMEGLHQERYAERDRLKAQLDVAVACLEHYAGMTGPVKLYFDNAKAAAALAKIKETP